MCSTAQGLACFETALSPLEFAEAITVNGTLLSTEGSNLSLQVGGPNAFFFPFSFFFYLLVSKILSNLRTVRHRQTC